MSAHAVSFGEPHPLAQQKTAPPTVCHTGHTQERSETVCGKLNVFRVGHWPVSSSWMLASSQERDDLSKEIQNKDLKNI